MEKNENFELLHNGVYAPHRLGEVYGVRRRGGGIYFSPSLPLNTILDWNVILKAIFKVKFYVQVPVHLARNVARFNERFHTDFKSNIRVYEFITWFSTHSFEKEGNRDFYLGDG